MDKIASRRDLLLAMCALPLIALPGVPRLAAETGAPAIGVAARRRFGAAVRPDQLAAPSTLRDTIIRQCDLLVPEYHGQWSAVEWQRGQPWYGNYDAITAFASATGKQVRGHSLIWEQMTPKWARDEMRHSRDWKTIERHFATLLPRYRGSIGEWIVVNEMIDTDNGHAGLRRTSFQRAFGNDYVRRALDTAHALDPSARLMINDFSLFYDNPVDEARRNAMLRLVEHLRHAETPVDVIGMQGHLDLSKGALPQDRIARFLSDLAGMDVDLAITELDVLEADRAAPLEERDRRVADAVNALLDVALDQPAMKSVVTWGMSDRHSWLQERAPTTIAAQRCTPVDCHALNRGLPYDGEMLAKPMQQVLHRVASA